MRRRRRAIGTSRIESFSDGVLAIVLTLLVLDLVPDAVLPPHEYLAEWPKYLAYLVAFLTVASVWINHHAFFARLASADTPVLVLNLLLLLGTSLVPWPTAAISLALRHGDHAAQFVALVVYAIVTVMICVPWALLDLYVLRNDRFLHPGEDRRWIVRHLRLVVATIVVAGLTVLVASWAPPLALVIYLVIVLLFLVLRVVEAEEREGRL